MSCLKSSNNEFVENILLVTRDVKCTKSDKIFVICQNHLKVNLTIIPGSYTYQTYKPLILNPLLNTSVTLLRFFRLRFGICKGPKCKDSNCKAEEAMFNQQPLSQTICVDLLILYLAFLFGLFGQLVWDWYSS